MFPKNRYAISIEECKKTFAQYGHKIEVPVEFLDPVTKEIMEVPIELNGVTERFDQAVLLQTSGDINIMNKTLVNPLTRQPADSFTVDKELLKKITMFVTGITMLADEFHAKQVKNTKSLI